MVKLYAVNYKCHSSLKITDIVVNSIHPSPNHIFLRVNEIDWFPQCISIVYYNA